MPPGDRRTGQGQVGRPGRGKPPRRNRAPLAERRHRQDVLIGAVIDALAARERAQAALASSQAAIDQAAAELTDLGTSGRDLANLLGVPMQEHRARGVLQRAPAPDTATGRPRVADGDGGDGGDGGAIRLWLAMIERGPAPKTHGLDRDGGLLCRGTGDPEHLTTWVGYPFDVDCHRCTRLLADQLTEEEFG